MSEAGKPSAGLAPAGNADALRFIRDAFAHERGRLLLLSILAGIGAVVQGAGLMLLLPLLGFLGVEDTGSGGEPMAWVPPFLSSLEGALILYLLVIGAAAMLARSRTIAAARLRLAFIDQLRERLHTSFLALEWRRFVRLRGSDIQQTIINEVARAGMAMEQLASLISASLVIPVMLVIAVRLSGPMALATLAAGALVALCSIPLNRRSSQLGQEVGRVALSTSAALADDLAGLRVVRSFSTEASRRALFKERLSEMRGRQLDLVAAAATSNVVVRACGAAFAALCLIVAVRRFGMGLAEALVFVLAFARLVTATLRLQEDWRRLLQSAPGYARARDMLGDFMRGAEPAPSGPPPAFAESLALEGICFRYDEAGDFALDEVNARFAFGRLNAIVGPSGAGKSTLIDLLLGLLAPDRGTISVDGVLLDDGARAAWRRSVGYVPQEPLLFHDTIGANLRIGNADAGDALLWEVLEQAAAADLVRGLPDGLDTIVGDRGGRLSGGERQRLTIARALLRRPALLLLDEATSAVDMLAEDQILAMLKSLKGKVTIIIVSHRSSILDVADHVVMMDRGTVVAEGPWARMSEQAGPLVERLQLR